MMPRRFAAGSARARRCKDADVGGTTKLNKKIYFKSKMKEAKAVYDAETFHRWKSEEECKALLRL